MSKSVAIIGFGVVGQAYHKVFPNAIVYDPPKNLYGVKVDENGTAVPQVSVSTSEMNETEGKKRVNACDVAVVAVWTGLTEDGTLDQSIVEEVVSWIECPLIIIKSALHPGTADMLVEKTGKRIAVSVEYIGEGNYPVHFWKYPHQTDPRFHTMLVVGGEDDVAEEAAQFMWRYLSPDIKIHKVTRLEAEICKLIENSYGALKVTFANAFLSLAQKTDSSFIRLHQAWNSDPRTDSMHIRAVDFERGWQSKCWDKDVRALAHYSNQVGAKDMARLFDTIIELNEEHKKLNENKD